jgi:hypothetical protein
LHNSHASSASPRSSARDGGPPVEPAASEHSGLISAFRLSPTEKPDRPHFAWVVAHFLEFGTSKMAKKPFLTQGWETLKQSALDAIIQKLKDAIGVK